MNPRSPIPRATYRLQLNRDFTFAQATALVPYLAQLGISHCYLSPCLKARPGSMHGYDIVDHNSFNPEIGTAEEFDRLVEALREQGMGVIMDIVPNHMGVMGSDNSWWLDVLENGEASIYANFFDIDWQPLKDELRGKVLVPVLHDHYGAVLESGEVKLTFEPARGEFSIQYRNHRFPVNPRQYPRILQHCVEPLTRQLGEQNLDLLEFQSLITAFGHLPARQEASADQMAERNRDKEINKRHMAELCARCPEIVAYINSAMESMNGTPGDPDSFEQLHELIKVQAYRLANWRVAADDINYRRFFDTNDLAGICMENESVFEATHRLVLKLIAEGKVDGLRIDHPDGLYNPAEYFERLKHGIAAATGNAAKIGECRGSGFVVIEKILTGAERLPNDWAVSGTTGYDFLDSVNAVFVDPAGLDQLTAGGDDRHARPPPHLDLGHASGGDGTPTRAVTAREHDQGGRFAAGQRFSYVTGEIVVGGNEVLFGRHWFDQACQPLIYVAETGQVMQYALVNAQRSHRERRGGHRNDLN